MHRQAALEFHADHGCGVLTASILELRLAHLKIIETLALCYIPAHTR